MSRRAASPRWRALRGILGRARHLRRMYVIVGLSGRRPTLAFFLAVSVVAYGDGRRGGGRSGRGGAGAARRG